jgi:hypothetical protein
MFFEQRTRQGSLFLVVEQPADTRRLGSKK